MAASCGHGRVSRPENFTMRAASHRLSTLVMVASTAAAGGIAATRKSTSRSALVTPGSSSGRPPACRFRRADSCVERVAQAGAEALGVDAEIGNGDDDDQRGENGGPDHQPARRIPFERGAAPPSPTGPRQHREIAEPPGRNAGAGQKGEEEHRAEHRGERQRAASSARDQRRPMAPAERRRS